MFRKPALVLSSTLFLLDLMTVGLSLDLRKLQYKHGRHQIKIGETKEESLLYWGYARGSSMSDIPVGKEYCYPTTATDGQPNEHIRIAGYMVNDEKKEKDEAVAFKSKGDVGTKQVCFYFLTKPGGSIHYTVHVYGTRSVPLEEEPPIEQGEVARQRFGKEMFAEPKKRTKPKAQGGKKPEKRKPKHASAKERNGGKSHD